MSNVVTVVDYGVGNLFSVQRALEHCGATVRLVSDPDELKHASKVLLPGVGAFADAMRELSSKGMDQAIKAYAASGAPLFGICLGMQMLLDSSSEFGCSEGLGLIAGSVEPIPTQDKSGVILKVPHIGWSSLVCPQGRSSWEGTLLDSIDSRNSDVYFVHSYMAVPRSPEHRIADCQYGDTAVAAVIGRDNVWGAQFHPEKSGKVGLSMLRNFVTLK
ncbi:imidazole glycerol phosphate synthase subunit HisH [Pseudomonas donghuensis]|uniref:imidazole glycerol phosphate synthase subunit HisH n=1 Tax=Pseudomonas donghuensis TaxID=1163398 RepID=UPI0020C43323|nr:imidazole glycerol phosphate synthase subunit HisH [Pseudomonas donghuensis]MBF4208537.1 imidazole glycerol phosphate synthase subunit HisH [Pseudomonas donghuensis]MCP6699711.1 imidazole glycerol phosphate synthase subunit HisH [Pseudomonas donghuensis]UVL23037.1 imidazole glycerol phosphate synthase subunit HisH [Pseudomonas donghuensis]